jgi:hypothetical protein
LWQAGSLLDDADLSVFATEAMESFCAAFDEGFYIENGPPEDALSVCHGAAGMLAIADAFAVHASHVAASSLAEQLQAYLLAHLEEVRELADTNMSLLTGTSGILAVLFVRCGSERGWLSQIALR